MLQCIMHTHTYMSPHAAGQLSYLSIQAPTSYIPHPHPNPRTTTQCISELVASLASHIPPILDDFLPNLLGIIPTPPCNPSSSEASNTLLMANRLGSSSSSGGQGGPANSGPGSWHSSHLSSYMSVEVQQHTMPPPPSALELGAALHYRIQGPRGGPPLSPSNSSMGSQGGETPAGGDMMGGSRGVQGTSVEGIIQGHVQEEETCAQSTPPHTVAHQHTSQPAAEHVGMPSHGEEDSLTDASWKVPPALQLPRASSAPQPPALPAEEGPASGGAMGTRWASGGVGAPAARSNRWLDARTRLLEELQQGSVGGVGGPTGSTVHDDRGHQVWYHNGEMTQYAPLRAQQHPPQIITTIQKGTPKKRQWLSFLKPSKRQGSATKATTTNASSVSLPEQAPQAVSHSPLGSFSFGGVGVVGGGGDDNTSMSDMQEVSFSMGLRGGRNSSGGSTPRAGMMVHESAVVQAAATGGGSGGDMGDVAAQVPQQAPLMAVWQPQDVHNKVIDSVQQQFVAPRLLMVSVLILMVSLLAAGWWVTSVPQ